METVTDVFGLQNQMVTAAMKLKLESHLSDQITSHVSGQHLDWPWLAKRHVLSKGTFPKGNQSSAA